ncbi:armadillo-like helical domain-containing protein 4 [Microcaecilia unicolor]|uniref:Armadillo-like helical domain-containing protein 4 n=1 Tax=Microcaecilia unicolor TaxID=1415580 RepID=A0A6P7Z339_9AMPH|nr:armadillo-like helical domain-containing protein 4 [Microcaecilia unicolor]
MSGCNHLQKSAQASPDMKTSMGFHICMFILSILLFSPGLKCVTVQKMDKTEAVHNLENSPLKRESEERRKGSTSNLETTAGFSVQAVWTAASEDHGVSTTPSETSLTNTLAIKNETKHHSQPPNEGVILTKGSNVYSPTEWMIAANTEDSSIQRQHKNSIGKEMLTTAVTTASSSYPDLEVEVFSGTSSRTTLGTSTEEEPGFTRTLHNYLFTVGGKEERKEGGISSKYPSASQLNTEEMLTTNPRTRFFKTVFGHSTISLLHVDQKSTTENGGLISSMASLEELSTVIVKPPQTEAYLSLNTEMDDATRDKTTPSNVSTDAVLNEEWDDTKVTSGQIKHIERGNTTQTFHMATVSPQVWNADQASRTAVPLTTDATTMKTEDLTNTGTAENLLVNMQEGELQTAFIGQGMGDTTAALGKAKIVSQSTLLVQHEERISMTLPDSIAPITDAKLEMHAPTRAMFRVAGPNEVTAEASQETAVTITSIHPTQGMAEVSGLMVHREKTTSETQTISSISQQWKNPESVAADVSHTASPSSFVQTPEGLNTVPGQDGLLAISKPATSPAGIKLQMEETEFVTMATALSVSSENTAVAPILREASTTVAYGLDKLQSEEREEEDEEEEDEEEDDEDDDEEEEEDEDKDTDATDESVEGDAELPAITLPGLFSHEPLGDKRNPTQLEGMGYRVPDILAWEHQNQGLVRSWMEKLKDKAGYMSGMLVPVGVGIAGAFFILGALYSIKFISRRRKNGYKRHKKKQREFNSMQDRVMLLADSSEDEF